MQIYRRSSRELFDLPEDLLSEDRRAENSELTEAARLWLAGELTREAELANDLWREAKPALAADSQLLALCARARRKHYSFVVAEFVQCYGADSLARLQAECPMPLLSEIQQRIKLPGQKALATLVRSHMKSNTTATQALLSKADEFGLARIDPISNLEFLARVVVSTEYVFPVASVGNLHDRAWMVLYDLCSGLYNHFALGRHASMVPGMVQTVTVSGFRANRVSFPPPGRRTSAAGAAPEASPAKDGEESAPEKQPAPIPDIRESLQLLSSAQQAQPSAIHPPEGAPPDSTADEGHGFRAALAALWGKVRGRSSASATSTADETAVQDATRSQM